MCGWSETWGDAYILGHATLSKLVATEDMLRKNDKNQKKLTFSRNDDCGYIKDIWRAVAATLHNIDAAIRMLLCPPAASSFSWTEDAGGANTYTLSRVIFMIIKRPWTHMLPRSVVQISCFPLLFQHLPGNLQSQGANRLLDRRRRTIYVPLGQCISHNWEKTSVMVLTNLVTNVLSAFIRSIYASLFILWEVAPCSILPIHWPSRNQKLAWGSCVT